jgi:hypothetical protein
MSARLTTGASVPALARSADPHYLAQLARRVTCKDDLPALREQIISAGHERTLSHLVRAIDFAFNGRPGLITSLPEATRRLAELALDDWRRFFPVEELPSGGEELSPDAEGGTSVTKPVPSPVITARAARALRIVRDARIGSLKKFARLMWPESEKAGAAAAASVLSKLRARKLVTPRGRDDGALFRLTKKGGVELRRWELAEWAALCEYLGSHEYQTAFPDRMPGRFRDGWPLSLAARGQRVEFGLIVWTAGRCWRVRKDWRSRFDGLRQICG